VGEAEKVGRFIDRLHEGSPPSRVERVDVEDAPTEGVEGFVRRPTA